MNSFHKTNAMTRLLSCARCGEFPAQQLRLLHFVDAPLCAPCRDLWDDDPGLEPLHYRVSRLLYDDEKNLASFDALWDRKVQIRAAVRKYWREWLAAAQPKDEPEAQP